MTTATCPVPALKNNNRPTTRPRAAAVGLAVALALATFADAPLDALAANRTQAAAQNNRPNIILAMADDQGYGDVGYMNHPVLKTPVLDDMARTALRFDRFYANSPVCSPTRAGVLTGRHPNRFGCFVWGYELRPREQTIAETLKKAGYTTGHFGKWHVGPVDRFGPNSPNTSGFDYFCSAPNFFDNDPLLSLNGTVIQTHGEGSMVTVDAALKFIEQAHREHKPFLALIWFGNPHAPHIPTKELAALYADQPEKTRNYLAEITGIDRAMGKLRKRLRDLNIADNTLLWYTSDNGPRPVGSTAGLRGWKGTVWEGGLRVPAMIEWPARITQPRRTSIPCGTVDIYPTLCDLLGIALPDRQPRPLDGQSLVPLIDGTMTHRDRPLAFWAYPCGGRSVYAPSLLKKLMDEQKAGHLDARQPQSRPLKMPDTITTAGHAALVDGDYKLHRIEQKGKVTVELYNLAKDRAETTNIAGAEPQRVKKMLQTLTDWQHSVARSYQGEDYH